MWASCNARSSRRRTLAGRVVLGGQVPKVFSFGRANSCIAPGAATKRCLPYSEIQSRDSVNTPSERNTYERGQMHESSQVREDDPHEQRSCGSSTSTLLVTAP